MYIAEIKIQENGHGTQFRTWYAPKGHAVGVAFRRDSLGRERWKVGISLHRLPLMCEFHLRYAPVPHFSYQGRIEFVITAASPGVLVRIYLYVHR